MIYCYADRKASPEKPLSSPVCSRRLQGMYIHSHASYSLKKIFDILKLDLVKVGKAFGIAVPPWVKTSVMIGVEPQTKGATAGGRSRGGSPSGGVTPEAGGSKVDESGQQWNRWCESNGPCMTVEICSMWSKSNLCWYLRCRPMELFWESNTSSSEQ